MKDSKTSGMEKNSLIMPSVVSDGPRERAWSPRVTQGNTGGQGSDDYDHDDIQFPGQSD